ncbi:hypothetical protein SAMN02745857_02586 [Andreprevotia lacus DSM 23236]|jgi:hypothetical protein|uniref:Uncharacterized protein n=1 Tax=Andreprevotia lacus DSM 23236 TaxID=1121001 RepID=A0A1W1XRT4_9NEIS|nr:hypothetical protein [Andreprevotia lacus]SMC26679.1 hypothetical protein SAMN02745857_02586 [Andreprevotia lacus DSM 23236]
MLGKLIRLLPWLLLAWLCLRLLSPTLKSEIHRGVRIAAVMLVLISAGALLWHLFR